MSAKLAAQERNTKNEISFSDKETGTGPNGINKIAEDAAGHEFDGIFIHVPSELDIRRADDRVIGELFAEKVVGAALEAIGVDK